MFNFKFILSRMTNITFNLYVIVSFSGEADILAVLQHHQLPLKYVRVLRSPSGEVDIDILCLSIFPLQAEKIWGNYRGTSDHRHRLNLIDLDDEKKLVLVGFHANKPTINV